MKAQFYGFALLILLTMKACESTDPSSLPNRPFGSSSVSVSSSSSNTSSTSPLFSFGTTSTSLQVLPPSGATISEPIQIDALRGRDYPGSDIKIESVLDPGINYSRYYVSYLSDGLKIYALMTVPNGPKPSTGWPVVICNPGYIPPHVYRRAARSL